MIAGINMESRVSYNVCIAMENRCRRIRIFGDFVCNERNCAENEKRQEIHAGEWYWGGIDTAGL